jgi:hypothetical protein
MKPLVRLVHLIMGQSHYFPSPPLRVYLKQGFDRPDAYHAMRVCVHEEQTTARLSHRSPGKGFGLRGDREVNGGGSGDLNLVFDLCTDHSAGVYTSIAHRPSYGDERPLTECELGKSRDPAVLKMANTGVAARRTRYHHNLRSATSESCAVERL